ncbi:type II toxin-antitoxin system prevent-host-death family antitoxin [Georgenia sp. TF02-10]|uniref:type II toxin-antitoxin system Phd/YefM family antitoxin n=1 Tax=Georgenia sp. TF02-10 TaxID=2917725 RepID=UPI001FA7698D|nr:type II toxin-antitoxin system prevent-host-death family antitoxin [Georgenia sp. TF02-10]UNX55640.1 type II toxin-antitoxin system prevent-host-death family antitoxin [Georgenia sp. TF02-10]
MGIIEPQMESLSQRELRNESGRVFRAVSEGHSFVLTNGGVPVGKIVPMDAPAPGLTIARPARREGGWSALAIERKTGGQSVVGIVDDLREDRV